MAVTVAEIARQVGVSHQVVSKVLNGGQSNVGASEETRKRIFQTAQKLGYRPHGASQALRSRSFRSIGVLMGGTEDHFYLPQEFMVNFCKRLAEDDYTATLVCARSIDAKDLMKERLLSARLVDGLAISYAEALHESVVREIEQIGVPVVWRQRVAPTNTVYYDDGQATELLLEHLAACGHRDVIYVDFHGERRRSTIEHTRINHIQSMSKKLRLRTKIHGHERIERSVRFQASRDLLSRPKRPTAAIVSSLTGARVLLQAALSLGLSVPDEFAVCSYDNGLNYNTSAPAITCAIIPESELGFCAADMVLTLVKQSRVSVPSKCLRCRLAIADSTVANA